MDDRGLGLVGACTITFVGLRFEVFGTVERNDGTFGKCEASLSGTWSVFRFGVTGSISVGLVTAESGSVMLDAKFSLGDSSVLAKLKFNVLF